VTAALQLPDLLRDKQDWTVDDLANLPKDLRYELIDGRLILPSPTGFHQDICVEISIMLRPNCPPGYRPLVDLSLSIDGRNEPRPDVVVLRKGLAMRSPAPVEGSILAVEVISPSSQFRDMHAKTKMYAAAGMESYWVVDPAAVEGVVLTEFRLGEGGGYEVVTSTEKVFTTDVPYPVTIDLPALTAMRDEYRELREDR
jgi:Uma2 family endonuclease